MAAKQKWYWTTWLAFSLSILSLILIIIFGFNSSFNDGSGKINPGLADNFGSFIGGLVGPILSLAGFFLIYETIIRQQQLFQLQQFENRYYELLRYHRDNVQQMTYRLPQAKNVEIVSGTTFFIFAVKEYDKLYSLIKKIVDGILTESELIEVTHVVHFYGVSSPIIPTLISALSKYDVKLITKITEKLQKTKSKYDSKTVYFNGQQHRLNHYWRHLSQVYKFIDQATFLSKKQRYEYAKIIRAQLSQQELIYFFYNSLSRHGKDWHKKNYINKYQIIKNLPKELSNKISPAEYYPKVNYDWKEIVS